MVEVEEVLADQVAAQRPGRVDRRADRVAVRPDQAAGAEQGAAEPAGDDGDHVADLAAAEHLEHRGARRTGRLAVVGRPLDLAAWTQDEAEQWCRASQCCLRSRSTTARAASSVSTRAIVQRKRDRLASISASASPATVR